MSVHRPKKDWQIISVTPEAWYGSILLHRLPLGRLHQFSHTLPKTNIAIENPPFWWYCIYKEQWGFSWAMLVSGRVCQFWYIILTSWTCLKFKQMTRKHFPHPSMEATDTLSRMKWSKNTNAPSTLGGHVWDDIVRFRVEEVWSWKFKIEDNIGMDSEQGRISTE